MNIICWGIRKMLSPFKGFAANMRDPEALWSA